MEDYDNWRRMNGLPMTTPKHRRSGYSVYISNQAIVGLEQIAESFGFTKKNKPIPSLLIEAIGLHQLEVTNNSEDYDGLIDPDGLTEAKCYEEGKQDYNEKRLPSFMDSSLAGGLQRSSVFVKAYAKGYMSAFIDAESQTSDQVNLEGLSHLFASFGVDGLRVADE